MIFSVYQAGLRVQGPNRLSPCFQVLLQSTIIATVFLNALPAHAQTTDVATTVPIVTPVAADSEPQDIVVTANRRAERAQRVGISLTAVTGEALADRNVQSVENLARLVPGLNATSATGGSVATFVIRGVGETDFSPHQEQPIAQYQDGTYIPFGSAGSGPIFDLQRVEVLRGPQGTLFGRNATGGLIQNISNKPVEGTSGAIEAAYGTRDLNRLQGFLNTGSTVVAGRLAFYYQDQKGFIFNALGRNRGDRTVYALRGQVALKPTDRTTITLRAEGFDQRGTPPGYISTPSYLNPATGLDTILPPTLDFYGTGPGKDLTGYRNPYSGLAVALDQPGYNRKVDRTYAATIAQELGAATLTSVTSYGSARDNYQDDTDSTPAFGFNGGFNANAHDFQQEVRVTGSAKRFRYTVGVFYLNLKGNYNVYNLFLNVFDLPSGGTGRFDDFYSLHTQSEAIYGQAEYDLADRLTAIAGGRYSWDQMGYNFVNQCVQTAPGACATGASSDPTTTAHFIQGVGPIEQSQKESDWSGKLQLNYKPGTDLLFYASISKGLKAGGFNAPQTTNFSIDALKFRPEKLYAFEIGEKSQIFNRRLTINTSLYYYDYKAFQTFLYDNLATVVLNRDATVYGGELELTAHPTRTINANVGVAYNHFYVRDINLAAFPGVRNQTPNNAPRLQLNWQLGKSFDLGHGLDLNVDYYGRYISQTFYNIINTPIVRAPSYSISDFSARLESRQGWYVAAYLNNAFDKRYQVGAFDITGLGYLLRQYGEVRTFSVAVGAKF